MRPAHFGSPPRTPRRSRLPRALALGALLGLFATSCGGPEEDVIDDLDVPDGSGKTDTISTAQELTGNWEYIVIGSGAGGGPLAANLARQNKRVLLLEAGEDVGGRLTYQVPAWHIQATEDNAMRWDYYVKHYGDAQQAARDTKMTYEGGAQKGILYPRTGALGGCTAHNAMITVYPHKSDWDYIAQLTGDTTWSGDNMRRYFARLERNRYLSASDDRTGHGTLGWLQTERADPSIGLFDTKILRMLVAGAGAFSHANSSGLLSALTGSFGELLGVLNRDLNTAASGRDSMEGLFSIPLATSGGQRNGTLEFIQRTVREGYPLTVRPRALATRVLFAQALTADGKQKAVGVEFLDGAHLYRADPSAPRTGAGGTRRYARAAREVIVAAGAFNTPQLLKLSGLGPKDELQRFGLKARVDLPGVGRNLQDRYEVGVISQAESDFSAIKKCTFGKGTDPCLTEWQTRRTGAYTTNGGVVAVVKKSTVAQLDPDLIIFGLPGAFKGYYKGYSAQVLADKRHFTWAILKGHTRNQAGTVTLRSADPRDTPEINFKYFSEGDRDKGQDAADMEAMVQGVEFVRKVIGKADDLSLLGSFKEVWPGPSVRTREQIAQFVRNEAWGHHASGTAKIGAASDPMAVLDSRFRVRGTSGLRVVDASVFPQIPGFFIVVPIYMISEKAADVILQDAR